MCLFGIATFVASLAVGSSPAAAFDNAIPEYTKYAKRPKRKGEPPKDLGVLQRLINEDSVEADPKEFAGLRKCDGKTNCFSTTGYELIADRIRKGPDTLINR